MRALILMLVLSTPCFASPDLPPAWVPAAVVAGWQRGDRDHNNQGTAYEGGALEGAIFKGAVSEAAKPGARITGLRSRGRVADVTVVSVVEVPVAGSGPIRLYELRGADKQNPCANIRIARDATAPLLKAYERASFDQFTGRAIAVPGAWGQGGGYVAASDQQPFFSFACMDGTIAKCVRWGYRADLDASPAALHQACVRAARADYCGNGTAFTCSGTTVDFVDASGIQPRAADTSGETIEALWGPGGALCLDAARLPGCGQKARLERVRRYVAARCKDAKHAIQIGHCDEKCKLGEPACGLIRTFSVAGAGTACRMSADACGATP